MGDNSYDIIAFERTNNFTVLSFWLQSGLRAINFYKEYEIRPKPQKGCLLQGEPARKPISGWHFPHGFNFLFVWRSFGWVAMDQTPAAMDRHLEVIQCHPGKCYFCHFIGVIWCKMKKLSGQMGCNLPLPPLLTLYNEERKMKQIKTTLSI